QYPERDRDREHRDPEGKSTPDPGSPPLPCPLHGANAMEELSGYDEDAADSRLSASRTISVAPTARQKARPRASWTSASRPPPRAGARPRPRSAALRQGARAAWRARPAGRERAPAGRGRGPGARARAASPPP